MRPSGFWLPRTAGRRVAALVLWGGWGDHTRSPAALHAGPAARRAPCRGASLRCCGRGAVRGGAIRRPWERATPTGVSCAEPDGRRGPPGLPGHAVRACITPFVPAGPRDVASQLSSLIRTGPSSLTAEAPQIPHRAQRPRRLADRDVRLPAVEVGGVSPSSDLEGPCASFSCMRHSPSGASLHACTFACMHACVILRPRDRYRGRRRLPMHTYMLKTSVHVEPLKSSWTMAPAPRAGAHSIIEYHARTHVRALSCMRSHTTHVYAICSKLGNQCRHSHGSKLALAQY